LRERGIKEGLNEIANANWSHLAIGIDAPKPCTILRQKYSLATFRVADDYECAIGRCEVSGLDEPVVITLLRYGAMGTFNRLTLTVVHVLLLLICASAFGDEAVTITIDNNTTKSLLVTVYDLNTRPAQRVLSSATINSFASVTVMIAADDSGQGHLSWTATSGNRNMRTCGHRDKPGLDNGDKVHVYANSECATN
jgi:hypothetical protein